jgi:predicted nucleic acid-binding protein
MHEKSTLKTIAKLVTLIWILAVAAPATYLAYTHASDVKEFAVVSGVHAANKALMKQYAELAGSVASKIDINKYAQKIEVPEIKLGSVAAKTEKVSKAAGFLAKVGVKDAAKVADTSAALQAQVDKVNKQLKEATSSVTKALAADLNSTLKSELEALGKSQMQKQLQLSDASYKNLVAERYGIASGAKRAVTKEIYGEFSRAKIPMVGNIIVLLEKYFIWIAIGIGLVAFALSLIPVIAMWWIIGKFDKNFTKCPYCGKVFLSKKAKFSLLGFVKFW